MPITQPAKILVTVAVALSCFVAMGQAGPGNAAPVTTAPVQLRCEYFTNPAGVDTTAPRFSWHMRSDERGARQTAYQVTVATTADKLKQNQADVWDSGQVKSDQSVFVAYDGPPLQSQRTYWWSVRQWDEHNTATPYSEPAHFQMGMLNQSDWQGEWIASDLDLLDHQKLLRALNDFGKEPGEEIWRLSGPAREVMAKVTTAPAVYLRHEFETTAPLLKATAFISGLGMHELYINGTKAGDHLLSPAYTDYQKRVLYETLDVTTSIQTGCNAVGVILGNGWFNLITPHTLRFHAADYISPPQLRMNLLMEYTDGTSRTVSTSPQWKFTTGGPIQFNCVLAGETYDARREMPGWSKVGFEDSPWKPARTVKAPEGQVASQMVPPVRVIYKHAATTVTRSGDTWRFHLGEDTAGWARVTLRGKPGQKVTISYPGSGSHTYGRYQTCEYYCKGTGAEVYAPRFSYGGYRYVDITGLDYEPKPSDVVAEVVNTDMDSAGSFACSDQRFNQIQEILLRTLRNFTVHIPADPTREKAGWTEDVHGDFFEHVYNFLAAPTYIHWQRDFINAVQPDGYVPPVAPSRFDGPDINGPWWGGVVIYCPWYLYQFYGDLRILQDSYPAMQKQFGYLQSIAKNDIIEWGLGDWLEVGSIRPVKTPVPLTSTAAYYYFAEILRQTSELLNRPEDAARYAADAQRIRNSYTTHFLNQETGDYATGSQTSQLVSLHLGLVPDEQRALVIKRFAHRIASDNYHLTSGFIGIPMLLTGLTELGLKDLAWTIATQPTYPGFIDAIINKGNGIMRENWEGGDIQMPTLVGPIGTWFYHSLAGIRVDPAAPGMKQILLKPETSNTLTWVKADHDSLYGRIKSEWKKDGSSMTWEVTVPPNSTATAHIPAHPQASITESGRPLSQSPGISIKTRTEIEQVTQLQSGTYRFLIKE